MVAGILIGSFYANHFSGRRLNIINTSSDKLNSLLHIIDDQYVDSVDIDDLVESSLPEILKKLDPHSVYIPAAESEAAMQDLNGSFSGIGVQFMIYKDTVRVVKVLFGGPAESVGLRAGDRIISIDGKPYVGADINNADTRERLKGESGTTVRVGIVRAGFKQPKQYEITRGDVPVKSIEATYMVDAHTGYMHVTSFGNTTYMEFLAALAALGSNPDFHNLIIDLRGNLGGYMAPAVQMVNEFLPKGRLIVYTQGRKSPRENFTSDGRGSYQNMPLVVLVDETSASASEIFAGAIQDNDRGTVIGRRTFGKGLVQVPIEFNDGSMLRLTKARYYTPAGRCVQKPYTPGDEEDYEQDLVLRAEHGEYFSRDSIKATGEIFFTRNGRTVYGGGGITPDVFIARDTTGYNSYFMEASMSGNLYQFAYSFTDQHRKALDAANNIDDVVKFLNKSNVLEQFVRFCEQQGIKRRNRLIKQARTPLVNYLYQNIIDDVLGIDDATAYSNRTDPAVLSALKLFNEGKAFPVAPQKATSDKTAAAVYPLNGFGRNENAPTWTAMLSPASYPPSPFRYVDGRFNAFGVNILAICPASKPSAKL